MSNDQNRILSQEAGQVAIASGDPVYDAEPPYSPGEAFPEYPFASSFSNSGPEGNATRNQAYKLVRESLHQLGLDGNNYGTDAWNPLGEIVRPGDTVVLKPNFVRDFRESREGDDDCVITHGSVIRAVADYVYIALQGHGRLILADAPQNDAHFDGIRRITQIDAIQTFYRDYATLPFEIYDLRPECAKKIDGVIVGHEKLSGDPVGYVRVNLGKRSSFYEINHLCHLLYGSEYDMSELYRHQQGETHEYLISGTILEADCVISIPKLKTHKKVGLTVNLKSLVGINGNKNWLPHHREGTPSQGGDQFADDNLKHRVERSTVARFKQVFPWLGPLRPVVAGPIKLLGKRIFGDTNTDTIRSGNWYGNDTTWRMVLDLNRILVYADAKGNLHDQPTRRFFSIVDGIVGGEGNGPLDPTSKPAGLIISGFNPVAVDLICARLMGFDHRRLPMLCHAQASHELPLVGFEYEQMEVKSNCERYGGRPVEWQGPMLAFAPHFGWRGHVELAGQEHEASVVA